MLIASCSDDGSDNNIQSSVVHTAHDVNISSYWHGGVFVSFSLLRPAAGFFDYEDTAGCLAMTETPRGGSDSTWRWRRYASKLPLARLTITSL